MHEVTLLIGGESRGASDGRTFERINPASGVAASRAAAATLADADAAVVAAARAFPAWSALAPTERRRRLLAAADLMDARTAHLHFFAVQQKAALPVHHNRSDTKDGRHRIDRVLVHHHVGACLV